MRPGKYPIYKRSAAARRYAEPFFGGFSIRLFLIKTIAQFFVFLGGWALVGEFNPFVKHVQDLVSRSSVTIFLVFLAWLIISFIIDLLRLYLTYDLGTIRWKTRQERISDR